jgi:PAS domain S-box-containing protein/putative nucleotidyltransferase with HDIG domain
MNTDNTAFDSADMNDILVVDDSVASLKLLTEILTNAGYFVRPVTDGALALRSIFTKIPTLILLDIRISNMDGFELCTRLKADPHTCDIPIIFLSSLGDIEDRIHGFALGAADYIAKPFQAQDILMRVKVHANLFQVQRQLKQKNLEYEQINRQLNQEISQRQQIEVLLRAQQENLEEIINEHTAELFKTKQRYQTLFIEARDGIVLIDATNGMVADCNPEFERQCARELSQLKNLPIWEVHPPQQATLGETLFQQIINCGSCTSADLDIQQPNGTLVPVEFVAKVIQIEERFYIQAMVRDISERKRIEAAHNNSEKRYMQLFNAMYEGFYLAELIFDETNTAIDWLYLESNPSHAKSLNKTHDDIVGKTASEVLPNIDKFWFDIPARTALTGEPTSIEAFGRISNRYYDCHYYSPSYGQFACIFNDITERKAAEYERDNTQKKLSNALENIIQTLTSALELRDPYTAGHQKRVAKLAKAIAVEMGLSEMRVQGLYFGGILHDIGKITIPAEILNKPGKISAIEYLLIKEHAQRGFDIVKDIDFPWPIAQMILQHHEHLDGSGYPQGLKSEEIILEAKILSVADVVEAIYSHRPYRAGLGIDKALAEITTGRGNYYEPQVVDACLRLFEQQSNEIFNTVLVF